MNSSRFSRPLICVKTIFSECSYLIAFVISFYVTALPKILEVHCQSIQLICRVNLFQINADRGSLFLARGTKDNKYLVSKLFDVTENSQLEDCLHTEENHITVPFGRGIAGTVALTKQPINIRDAYQV